MALSKIDAANFLTGTIPQGNVANASLGAVTALPGAIATGKVLQVVTTAQSTEQSSSSTSFISCNTSVDITPSSTSNKILITVSGTGRQNNDGDTSIYTIFRDSTNLQANANEGFSQLSTIGATRHKGAISINFLDTPSSTSEITYSLYMRSVSGGTVRSSLAGSTTTITAYEIAG